VGVFPEATISRSFELKAFKSGAVRMAQAAQVPVLPMIIWGSQRVWTKGHPKRLGRTNVPITLSVGAPIVGRREDDADDLNLRLRTAMTDLLHAAQEAYPAVPGDELKYLPARLGGTAPTLEQATALDDEEALRRGTRPGSAARTSVLISLLRSHLRPYTQPIALIVLFQLIQTIASLYLPGLNAQIIDQGVVTGDTGYIVRTGAVMLAVTVLQILCAVAAVYFGARTAMALGRDLRESVFVKVESFAAQEVGRFGAPSLITRSTNDIQQVQMLVLLTFTMMIAAPIMCVGGVIMALRQDVVLSSLLLVIVPVLLVCVALIISRMRPLFRSMQTKIDLLNRILREQIGGVRVIRAFVKDTHERERFDGASTDLMDVSVRVGRLMALMFPTVMLIMNVSSVAVMWFGGHRIASGQMQIGTLTAFLSYLLQILMSVMMATFMFVMLPRAEVSAERIKEVLDTVPSVRAPQVPQVRTLRTGVVELCEASFSYPGAQEAVLHGVSMIARPGHTTAIVGSTGSGKSTLLNLIPRLVDVTGGMVLLDGHDIRALDPKDLRSSIGLVPQRPYLFGGT